MYSFKRARLSRLGAFSGRSTSAMSLTAELLVKGPLIAGMLPMAVWINQPQPVLKLRRLMAHQSFARVVSNVLTVRLCSVPRCICRLLVVNELDYGEGAVHHKRS